MKSIRFNRHSNARSDGWVWDCYITPEDKVEGEVHNNFLRLHQVYNSKLPTNTFNTLWSVINNLPSTEDSDGSTRLVISTIDDGKKRFYFLKGEDEYKNGSLEKQIWDIINSIFQGTKFVAENIRDSSNNPTQKSNQTQK